MCSLAHRTFVPPHHERITALIDDLVAFANRVDLPVLVQTAIAQAQFETIHPFPDGNGRVGRALIQAMLRGGSQRAMSPFRSPRVCSIAGGIVRGGSQCSHPGRRPGNCRA
ncbi:MAG: Fic family protein [Acidobacteria bacterium]|nr:Fic family protein [Acidobacteriota bacterium]